jgi:hypothetical protein
MLAAALGLAICGAAPASAETVRLQYEAVVLGVVTLGTSSYEVTYDAGRFSTRATVQTAGLARLFDNTNVTATSSGSMSTAGPAWSSYNFQHSYANKSRRVELLRTGTAVQANVNPRYGNLGDPPASQAQQSASFDPVTGLFALGRRVAATGGCSDAAVLVFYGLSHYRLAAGGGTRGTYSGGGYDGPALRCSLSYQPIAGFKDLAAARRAPVGEVWFGLSTSDFAPLLQISVPTPLGAAQLNLKGYEAS